VFDAAGLASGEVEAPLSNCRGAAVALMSPLPACNPGLQLRYASPEAAEIKRAKAAPETGAGQGGEHDAQIIWRNCYRARGLFVRVCKVRAMCERTSSVRNRNGRHVRSSDRPLEVHEPYHGNDHWWRAVHRVHRPKIGRTQKEVDARTVHPQRTGAQIKRGR